MFSYRFLNKFCLRAGARRPWSDEEFRQKMEVALAAKIARFHLIDTVRGEGVTWPEEAVQEARLTLRVESSGEGLGTFDETELTLLGDVTLTEKGREKQVRHHTAAGAVFPHQLTRRRAVRACPAGGCGWGWARTPGALA